jgi:hypothetical protein
MNLVTIDTSPGNFSMYIAPNNTSYLELGKNASSVIIGNSNCSTNVNGPLVMGTGKNITLQPTTGYVTPTSGMLGYIVIGSFNANTALTNGSFVSTPSFNITPGNYIITITIKPQPGYTSGVIFTGAYITITSSTNNQGTEYYSTYDASTKPNLSYGTAPYLAMYSYSAIVTITTSLSLYLNFRGTFSISGSNTAPNLGVNDTVSFMRIA